MNSATRTIEERLEAIEQRIEEVWDAIEAHHPRRPPAPRPPLTTATN